MSARLFWENRRLWLCALVGHRIQRQRDGLKWCTRCKEVIEHGKPRLPWEISVIRPTPSEWVGSCFNRECSCFAPSGYVCEEFKGDGRNYRCYECGWPEPVHEMRDLMADAGLRLVIGTEPIHPLAEESA